MSKGSLGKKDVDMLAAQEQLPSLLDAVRRNKSRIVIHENGTPVAAIVSARDLEMLEFYERKRAEAFETLKQISKHFEDVPLEELEQEVSRAVMEARIAARRHSESDAMAS